VVFGFLSFAGFEAASTLGEEANRPTRDIPRAILGTAIFGGVYFVIVTAVEMMGFGTGKAGVAKFGNSPSLLGDLGSSYVGHWVGDVITLGTTVSAFGCCLASTVGAARLIYALSRDTAGPRGLGAGLALGHAGQRDPGDQRHVGPDRGHLHGGLPRHRLRQLPVVRHHRHADPARRLRAGHDRLHDAGVRARKLPVPMWQIVVPIAAIVVLGYTLYRNVSRTRPARPRGSRWCRAAGWSRPSWP
jgi:hypothetical protein